MASKPSPRPIALLGYTIVFITFGVFGSWAAIAKLDSAVVAPGTVSLEGNRKVIQHLEGGIVAEILVSEADMVQEGDVLLRLSDVESRSNLEVVRLILELLGKDPDDFEHVTDRAGHDLRYAIDSTRLRTELGWQPRFADFEAGLERTIDWYREHESWWRPAKEATEAAYAAKGQ